MLSDGFFRIGDYIWDWGSKKWIKCKEHHHMSHFKDYHKTNDYDRKEWLNNGNECKEENKNYWKDYHDMTKKHWKDYKNESKKFWEMNKEEMKNKWMDECQKNINTINHNCKINEGCWCEKCPYYNKTKSANDNNSENVSKNEDKSEIGKDTTKN